MTNRTKLIIIVILALLIRVGLLVRHQHTYYASGLTQGLLARNIAEGRGLVGGEFESKKLAELQAERGALVEISEIPVYENDTYRPFIFDMPGYGILLAGIWSVTGHYNYIYVRVLQIVIDSLMVFLIFWIVRELFDARSALIAGLLYAIYLPQAFMCVHPLRDCWSMFVVILIVYLIIQYKNNPTLWKALGIGLLVGAGTYLRPNLAIVTVPVCLFAIPYLGRWKATKLLFVSLAVVVLMLMPWWVRNYKIFHKFIPLSANGGAAFWGGMGMIPNQYGFGYSDEVMDSWVKEQGLPCAYGTPEFSDVLRERAFDVMKKDPLFYLKTVAYRIPLAVFPAAYWGLEPPDYESKISWNYALWREQTGGGMKQYAREHPFIFLYKALRWVGIVVLFLAGLAGIWLRRKQYPQVLLLISVPFYFIGAHSTLTYPNPRYLLPGTWVYLVFAGIFLQSILGRWKRNKSSA